MMPGVASQFAAMAMALYTYFVAWTDPHSMKRRAELFEVATDIASTDCSDDECFMLASIAMHESYVRVHALGRLGERGAFQVMPPGKPGAHEALLRLRRDGLQGYAGCTSPCPRMVEALGEYARKAMP